MHIGVFDVLNKVLFQKLTGDSFKKTLFFCRFLRFFAFAFKSLIFLCWPFLFLVLNFCVFLFWFSCCCGWTNLVAMFGFLFLLFWVSLFFFVVCVLFFVFGLFCFFMEGLGVR